MNIFKNKNDYSIIAFDNHGNVVKSWTFVHGLYKTALDLNRLTPTWCYMNVYNRRTRSFMKRYYRNNYIPNKPKF